MALQTASKTYVDASIAQALSAKTSSARSESATSPVLAGQYVPTAGGTMTGPLVLPADPVSPMQAADKNYVDENVAQVASGMATKVSTLPTAAQTVAQPAGTQLEVNRLNGELDASGFVSGGGNNGFANALASADCTSGCEVHAGPTYPGTESVPAGAMPSGTHVRDLRGGTVNELFQNPLAPGLNSSIGLVVTQLSTRSEPQMEGLRPGLTGADAQVMSLTQTAPTGGSNQFPASVENVPYNKSNYGVLQLTGNYNTQGQHVQFGNQVNCWSVGDCLAGGQFIQSAGGYRDQADEGTHPFDLEITEAPVVYQGTCANGCTTGSTSVQVNATAGAGTQGDGRFLIDKSPSKVISAGVLSGADGGLFQQATFSGVNFPVSVFLQLAQAATSQAGNLAPGTVTLPIMTSGVQNGVFTDTKKLPTTSGVACVADPTSTGVFPNFETATYTTVDATHLRLTLNKVHAASTVVAVGGLCGYGLEQTVDTVGAVKQVFPVVGSPNATALYYAQSQTGVVGYSGFANTSAYLNVSLPIASVSRNGNIVTLVTSASFPYDLNGLSLTVSGVADASYNGTFAVTTVGSNTLTYPDAGANSTSTGGSLGMVTGGFNLYPMAEVLSVYNAATAAVDGTLTLAPNTVAWAAGDAVEQPHFYQQLVFPDMELINQFEPRPIQYVAAGKSYGGVNGPGLRGWQISNATPASSYLGAGGTHQPPDDAYVATGIWRNTFEAQAGQEALLRVHCNGFGCNRWDSAYALFSLDSHQGQDFLVYDPSSNAMSWNLAGTGYQMSPSGFTAGTINATKLVVGAGVSSGTAANTDLVGVLVLNAGATSSASYSFSGAHASAPVCLLQPQNATAATVQALGGVAPQVSASGVSVSVSNAPGVSVSFGYVCTGRN